MKGTTPRIENQITNFAPNRSPIGPPMITPAADAPSRMKRRSCAYCTETSNFSMAKNV
ncbi:hypothetical protein D3C83_255840 [compost metagenome]